MIEHSQEMWEFGAEEGLEPSYLTSWVCFSAVKYLGTITTLCHANSITTGSIVFYFSQGGEMLNIRMLYHL